MSLVDFKRINRYNEALKLLRLAAHAIRTLRPKNAVTAVEMEIDRFLLSLGEETTVTEQPEVDPFS